MTPYQHLLMQCFCQPYGRDSIRLCEAIEQSLAHDDLQGVSPPQQGLSHIQWTARDPLADRPGFDSHGRLQVPSCSSSNSDTRGTAAQQQPSAQCGADTSHGSLAEIVTPADALAPEITGLWPHDVMVKCHAIMQGSERYRWHPSGEAASCIMQRGHSSLP